MFLDNATKTYSEKQFLETEINKLKQEREKNEEAEPDTLKTGIKALSQWLQEQMSSGISGKWLWFLTIAGALTAGATFMFGWYGLLGIAVLVVLSVYALQNKPTNETNVRQEDYLKTGLEAPEEWNIEQVTDTLNHLSERLSSAWYKDKLDKKIEQRDEDLEKLQARLVEVETAHQEWEEKLKAAPDLPESDVKNYSGLYWFLVHAKEWQENHAEVEAISAQKEELEKKKADLLKEINEAFGKNNAEKANDIADAKAIYNKLYKDEEKRRENTREIERQNEVIEKNKGIEQDKRQKLQGIYKKLDLQEGEKEQVRVLVEKLDNYKETKSNYQIKQSSLKEKETRMQEHSMYKEKQNEVFFLSTDEVEEQIQQYEQQALEQERISKEITEIETNIKNAKAKNDLEDALKNKEQELSELEELYERNLSALTGSVLVEELKKETQNKNRTPVLKRANKIFNRITRGRYELQLTEENGKPVFKALDTVLNLGQHLDELSTGTRIQLLLSVRVAFVETQESALKLPILADELLANSDDARAKAIIDALVEISRDGRQVFYFTAQGDEVAKWKHHMGSVNDVSYKVIEISGENKEKLAYDDYQPPFETFRLKQTDIPHPSGKTHEAYGKELQVSSFDLLSQSADNLHLWYLIEEPVLLYKCLSLGIWYWGQFQSFIENNGVIQGLDSEYIKKLKDKAALLERFQELYRQGRPVPIERSVLEDSGAVSENFIEPVSQKLEEVNRNPKQLIQALRDGEVPRFIKSKINELEEFLFNQGYIREEEVLKKDEILVNLQAMISKMEVERGEVEQMIELVMQSVDRQIQN
ncbi:MAG: ATP-binding protein, partial [Bacteroidota bacterium]